MIDNLQDFLQNYEQMFPHDVWRIRERIPRDFVITGMVLEAERQEDSPVLIFEDVEGSSMPIVSGLFSSRKRIAHILGTTPEQMHEHWIRLSNCLVPPIKVQEQISQEVVIPRPQVDLNRIPLMRHFKQDAGPYLTSGVVVSRDPDTGIGNLSYVRMQLKGPNRFGISMHSRGHQWDNFRRAELKGRGLEVAVIVGAHPALLIGAACRLPADVDEYDIAGAILGQPIEVVPAKSVDLLVPAKAEIILEGIIEANVREPEGPFGEYTGYTTGRSTQNIFTVTAITHRRNPLFLDICPGAARDHLFLSRVQREAEALQRLRQALPNVVAIHYPVSGTHFHCYLSIKKQQPGDARQAALLLLGIDKYAKLVVVVDDDIDVMNEAEVLWAIATRVQPHENAFVLDGLNCNILDPSSKEGLSSKLVIDATKPPGWDFERCSIPEQERIMAINLVRKLRNFTREG
ncbi:MAG: UbiD family decarboxylase [Anaerolineaceae bacterium]|nr:UbiD family decarboxylase [Anaerolineaceae bacterium]